MSQAGSEAMFDTNTEFGARVQRRLAAEEIIWLVTIAGDLTPQPSPVWFLWERDSLLIYSRPDTPKLRNIEQRPRVALHFDSDEHGDDIIVIAGDARIDPATPPADQIPAYVRKYAAAIERLGMTPESFARDYSAAIRVTPTRVRGH
jgi:PPOX class probable F420-dependent enzyme